MAKLPIPPTATEEEIRALLERYRCPVPFHEVRTRFLGNIASPGIGVSPAKMVEGLWGGELPEFGSINTAKELIGALIMGLWNRPPHPPAGTSCLRVAPHHHGNRRRHSARGFDGHRPRQGAAVFVGRAGAEHRAPPIKEASEVADLMPASRSTPNARPCEP